MKSIWSLHNAKSASIIILLWHNTFKAFYTRHLHRSPNCILPNITRLISKYRLVRCLYVIATPTHQQQTARPDTKFRWWQRRKGTCRSYKLANDEVLDRLLLPHPWLQLICQVNDIDHKKWAGTASDAVEPVVIIPVKRTGKCLTCVCHWADSWKNLTAGQSTPSIETANKIQKYNWYRINKNIDYYQV